MNKNLTTLIALGIMVSLMSTVSCQPPRGGPVAVAPTTKPAVITVQPVQLSASDNCINSFVGAVQSTWTLEQLSVANWQQLLGSFAAYGQAWPSCAEFIQVASAPAIAQASAQVSDLASASDKAIASVSDKASVLASTSASVIAQASDKASALASASSSALASASKSACATDAQSFVQKLVGFSWSIPQAQREQYIQQLRAEGAKISRDCIASPASGARPAHAESQASIRLFGHQAAAVQDKAPARADADAETVVAVQPVTPAPVAPVSEEKGSTGINLIAGLIGRFIPKFNKKAN